MGVVRLMDLTVEREVVRNEALLIMIVLTHANPDIQKIAAFEGAFDRLLEIIKCTPFSFTRLSIDFSCDKVVVLVCISDHSYSRQSDEAPWHDLAMRLCFMIEYCMLL